MCVAASAEDVYAGCLRVGLKSHRSITKGSNTRYKSLMYTPKNRWSFTVCIRRCSLGTTPSRCITWYSHTHHSHTHPFAVAQARLFVLSHARSLSPLTARTNTLHRILRLMCNIYYWATSTFIFLRLSTYQCKPNLLFPSVN